jgi:glycosyltransferase involved in cell wall biosynthesis
MIDKKDALCVFDNKIDNPKYSICIPTFKRDNLLKLSIESALFQDDSLNYEIVIVDNDNEINSSTNELLENYRNNFKVSYYKNIVNLGMVGNWNQCLFLAKGDYIVYLHDDDMLKNNYLTIVNQIIIKNSLDALYPSFQFIFSNLKGLQTDFTELNKYKLLHLRESDFLVSNPIGPPVGACLNRLKAIECGGFNKLFYPSIDYEFYQRFSKKYTSAKVYGEPLTYYRVMDNESLKLDTLKQFLEIDFKIQSNVLKNIKNNLFKFIPSYIINNKEVFYKIQYYKNLELHNELNNYKKSLTFINFINFFVIKVLFKIKIYFRKFRFKSI